VYIHVRYESRVFPAFGTIFRITGGFGINFRNTGGYLKARISFTKSVTGRIFRIIQRLYRSKQKLYFYFYPRKGSQI
jgi:hypothetical protein